MPEKSILIRYLLLAIVIQTSGMAAAAKARPAVNNSYPDRARPTTVINLRDAKVRRQHVESLAQQARQAKDLAWREAHKHGWKIKGTVRGRSYELMAIEDGRPVYKMTCNANAAISTGANLLHSWPYSLDGNSLTVGLWDAGDVRATHQEFGSRVTIKDFSGLNNHSTHVAGTIGAQGVDPAAKGMAPAVNIDSYDWDEDTSEMASRAAAKPGEAGKIYPKIYLSNHSYGFVAGWQFFDDYPSGPGLYWFGVWGEREDRNFGRYNSYASNWDLLVYSAPYYLPFKAVGNDRRDSAPPSGTPFWYWDSNIGNWMRERYDSIRHPKDDGWPDGFDTILPVGTAKNIMTVGAVEDAVTLGLRDPTRAWMTDFSGWGPTDDGRIKPDIVANGWGLYSPIATSDISYDTYTGTSTSSPSAAGSAALLVQYYNSLFPGEAMRASTLKGLIIHTATDLGNPGPDYRYGWGLMDVNLAANYIRQDFNDANGQRIIEGVLAPGTSNIYTFTSDGSGPIRVTLCWTDPPGPAINGLDNNTPVLINDLDLRIIDNSEPNKPYEPYILVPNNPGAAATTGDNTVDNVEQVYIALPVAGTYTVEISHKGTLTNGLQYYSLILSKSRPTRGVFVDDNAQFDPVHGVPDAVVGGPDSDPDEDGSSEHPFDSIGKAINSANDGDSIIVRDGTYTGVGNYDIDLIGKMVTVKSETGPAECIVDCQWNGRAFVFQSGESTTTVLDGLTIIRGYAEDTSWPQEADVDPSGYGGAIYCKNSSPLIDGCVITDNIADAGGGGIFCDRNNNALIADCNISFNQSGYGFYIYGLGGVDVNDINQPGGGIYCKNGSPTISNCVIIWNVAAGAGGGIACQNSDAMIMGCRIKENECYVYNDDIFQYGGGIFVSNGSPTITNCLIEENVANDSGGGIAAVWDTNDTNNVLWIDNCGLTDNHCWASGGGFYCEGNPAAGEPNVPGIAYCRIRNCLIADNWGYWSGGVSITDSGPNNFVAIENCTIADNKVPYHEWVPLVGGLECWAGPRTTMGAANVTNSIIWGNKGKQIEGLGGTNNVTYSDIQVPDSNDPNTPSIWPGEGNINAVPLFANPIGRDYHLQTEYPNGRWDPKTGLFDANDPNTSGCINAGDPFSGYWLEPAPNGDRINMGAYGNTLQASKSGIIRPVPADIASDFSVDMVDFALLAEAWRLEGAAIKNRKADIDNNGIVDERDLFILGKFWLWQQH